MNRYIAFLRGINISGKNKINMLQYVRTLKEGGRKNELKRKKATKGDN